MSSEIWGSKSETYEGTNDHEEKIYDENRKIEEEGLAIDRILRDIMLEDAIEKQEAAEHLIEKAKELMQFIEENYEYLCLIPTFEKEKFTKIETYSNLSVEYIVQRNSLEEIQSNISNVDSMFDRLRDLCEYEKKQKAQQIQKTAELVNTIVKKAKEIMQFIEEKKEILSLDKSYIEKDFSDIRMFSELTDDIITQNQANKNYEDIESILAKFDSQLDELNVLYDQIKIQVLQNKNFISMQIGMTLGTDFFSQLQYSLKVIKDPTLKEKYNDKYILTLDKIFKEYSESRNVAVCREMLLEFYSEVNLLITMQNSMDEVDDKIKRYDKPSINSHELYLDENNYINASNYELIDLLFKGDFNLLIQEGREISQSRLVQLPSADSYSEQPLITRRTEKRRISSSYKLMPREFLVKNSQMFCYMLNSDFCQGFIDSMNSFIGKLKNNEIMDHSNNPIKTSDIGIELEKEFLDFLIVVLYKINNNNKLIVYNYIQKQINNLGIDFSQLFVLLAKEPFDKTDYSRQLVYEKLSLMTSKEKKMLTEYLNISKTNEITKVM